MKRRRRTKMEYILQMHKQLRN